MVSKILLGAAVGICVAVASYASMSVAQEPACRFFKIQSDNVNISKEPRGDSTYIDVLDTGDIVCATRDEKTDGRDWVFIAHKLVKPAGQRKPVNGWANPKLMQPASATELAAVQGTPAPAPAAQPPAAAAAGQKVVKFSDPIPFGPVTVAGKTLEQLAQPTRRCFRRSTDCLRRCGRSPVRPATHGPRKHCASKARGTSKTPPSPSAISIPMAGR
jgi:hypothetical protein